MKYYGNSQSHRAGAHPSKVTLLSGENREKNRRDHKLQRVRLTEEPYAGIKGRETQEARAEGSGELRAQESLNSCVDVPSHSD